MTKPSFKKLRNTLIISLTFGIPIALIIIFGKDIINLEKIIPKTGILGPIVSILLMGLLSATPIPTDPIVIINGAIFGPFTGVFVSWMGNNLATLIEYYIGRGLSEVADFEKLKNKMPKFLSRFPADSAWFLFFGRFIPQFGGKIVSLVGGFYRVPLPKYLLTAAASNLLGSSILAIGGYSLLHLLVK